ncbi:MAG TPA: flagellar hook-associated protein FlgK [Parasulfuritortus sp.]
MTTGILGTALLGLNAARTSLNTTSLNISNVDTTGYHRQITMVTTNTPMSSSTGSIGTGVNVSSIVRAYNSFLEKQVLSTQGQVSNYETYTQYATQLNSILGSQDSTLSSAMSGFFSSVQNLASASDPTSTAARQSLLSAATTLASQFSSVSSSLGDIATNVNQQVTSIAAQVTNYAKSIANLNQQIAASQAGGSANDTSTNALMDQRDAAVSALNKLVNVTVLDQGRSGYNVYVGNGEPLVVGTQVNAMVASANPSDPTQLQPAIQIGSNAVVLDSSQITGGQLGGLLSFRNDMLVPTQRELGTIAYSLASTMNSINAQGYDLYGAAGGNFFSTPTVQDPIANLKNTGNGVLSLTLTDSNKLANSDYKLSFDGTNYTVTRMSDGTSYSNSSLAALSSTVSANEGFSLTLNSGTIKSGDTYLIRPTQYSAASLSVAITDVNKIAAAGQGVTASAAGGNTGTATISGASLSSTVTRPVANVPITLTYASATGTFTVTDSTSATLGTFSYTSGSPITFNGISVTVTGAPANGDSFTVTNSGASAGNSDNSNALLMANLQTQKVLSNGSNTLSSEFTQLVTQNATQESSATSNQSAYQALNTQATSAQQSFSGVNLDEEAANLIKYQQAYQAAAKVMQVASTLFDTILNSLQ